MHHPSLTSIYICPPSSPRFPSRHDCRQWHQLRKASLQRAKSCPTNRAGLFILATARAQLAEPPRRSWDHASMANPNEMLAKVADAADRTSSDRGGDRKNTEKGLTQWRDCDPMPTTRKPSGRQPQTRNDWIHSKPHGTRRRRRQQGWATRHSWNTPVRSPSWPASPVTRWLDRYLSEHGPDLEPSISSSDAGPPVNRLASCNRSPLVAAQCLDSRKS